MAEKKFTNEQLLNLVDQAVPVKLIAQQLGVTQPAVRNRLKRIRAKEAKNSPIVGVVSESICKEIQDNPKCFILKQEERLFIDLYLVHELDIKSAMISAGYDELSETQLYYHAKRILKKYEAGAEDTRDIMRTLGAGEVEVISRMLHMARHGKSETARVQAISKLGQWLGLDKEMIQGAQGIQIIFEGGSTGNVMVKTQDVGGPAQPDQAQAPIYTGRVLQITK